VVTEFFAELRMTENKNAKHKYEIERKYILQKSLKIIPPIFAQP
jgi:hypothetical protein